MKRILSALLALLMLCPAVLTSCGDDSASGQPSDTSSAETTSAEVSTEPVFDDGLDDSTDLKGYEIHFIGKGESFGSFRVYDVYAAEETGDLIEDAVYKRNRKIEEQYNFKIKFTTSEGSINGPSNGNRPGEIVQKLILAGDDTYDVIYDGLTRLTPLAQNGSLYDFNDMDHINFAQPWWDEQMNSQLSLLGKQFFACGSHMLGPYDGLYCILFNKKLVEDYKLGDMYALVDNNKWTLDTFGSLLKDRAVDVNGDGTIGEGDLIPYFTEPYNFYTFMIGAGVFTTEKDKNDVPQIIADGERTYDAIDKINNFWVDSVSLITDVMTAKGNDYGSAYYINGFVDNQFIFREGAMMEIPKLRDMEADFGILPNPKFDENQDEYYHTFSVMNAAMMSVPINVKDSKSVGFILEAMAAESYNSLMPVYIERQLKSKMFRDNESEKVLHIILDSMFVDIIDSFSWASPRGIYQNIAYKKDTKFASSFASNESAFVAGLEKLIEDIENIG